MKRETFKITNTLPVRIFTFNWQPHTFTVVNYTRFPIYVNVGSIAIPSLTGFTDIIPQFFFFSVDPVEAKEFAIAVDNKGNEAEAFAQPINVIFSEGGSSAQAPISLGL
jgi:amino acid permease